jgi:hypothetical protein
MSWKCYERIATIFMAELSDLEKGVRHGCQVCNVTLPKTCTRKVWRDGEKKIVSFWLIKCPACNASHIIFNGGAYEPRVVETPAKPPDEDPGQAQLSLT